jgi:hypothetical protein
MVCGVLILGKPQRGAECAGFFEAVVMRVHDDQEVVMADTEQRGKNPPPDLMLSNTGINGDAAV